MIFTTYWYKKVTSLFFDLKCLWNFWFASVIFKLVYDSLGLTFALQVKFNISTFTTFFHTCFTVIFEIVIIRKLRRNATRCNNRDDLLHLSFTLKLKFQYFERPVYNPVEHLWRSFYCKNSKPLSIFTKIS